jgi:phospholipid/cholesterol/gamma-HCH transport system substrate-binding protein
VKSFTERNPLRVGLIALAVMTALVLAVLLFNRNLFASGYDISARFPNAAGIGKGTEVTVAGVKVGSVDSVAIEGNSVVATMTINHGVVLPRHTTAAIQVQTLLGVLDVALQPVAGWATPLHPGTLITDTSVPTEFYQLQNEAGRLLTQTDATAFNNLVTSLAGITKGKQQQVAQIIDGLGKLTTTVNARQGEVSQLIDASNQLAGTLAGKDQELTSVIDNLNTVAGGLAAHSGDLASLIDNVDAMASQTNSLVGQNRPQLNALLQSLHQDLGVVGQHQVDLAQTVSYLASALTGFASVGYSGPQNTPNSWANIYVNTVTTLNAYGVLGPCGALDLALNAALGPDPLACDAQTGPLPGEGATGTPPTGTADGPAASPAGSGATGKATGSSAGGSISGLPLPGPDTGVPGLNQLLSPLASGLKKGTG